jgi:hypothetical protein
MAKAIFEGLTFTISVGGEDHAGPYTIAKLIYKLVDGIDTIATNGQLRRLLIKELQREVSHE